MSTSRIIIKNLPKKISEEKFQQHFSKIAQVTDSKLKYSKDGKFRQFGFIGYKTEEDAMKAIEYFNNTFIDASRIVVETCKPLNDSDRQRPWSKYSKESSAFIKHNPEAKAVLKATNKAKKKESIEEKKEKKLERLVGQLKDDKEFIEFLATNKAIKTKENIWKNDIINPQLDTENKSSDMIDVPIESKIEDNKQNDAKNTTKLNDDDADFENGRLYVRNLHYGCKEEDLEILFKPYGPLVEVNMPIDTFSKKPKGFAHITCMFPEKALKAFNDLDGKVFQGRMLHILPGKTKEDPSEADAISEGMNFKKKKELELKKKAQSNHNWNSLFINSDSVANLMSARYNVEKSQIFDVHSSVSKNKAGNSIAVKLAVGETQIVNDMRKFLIRNGVKLDALGSNSTQRSKTVILIKNLPNNTNEEEVRELLKKQGINDMKRLVMPEFGIACLVEFSERQEARDAFKKLAYKKFKTGPLYLEWAPEDIFEGDTEEKEKLEKEEAEEKSKEAEKKEQKTEAVTQQNGSKSHVNEEDDDDEDYEENATLFVKNLNFDTTEESLQKLFSKIGKCKATIARKLSPNKESLSMGYGFVRFKKASNANEAIKTLQNQMLDGHNLELKFSNRTQTTSNQGKSSRKSTTNKTNEKKSSKILVRNIPFEAKAKEIEELFHVFGELKYVRLPKKVDGAHRGFGFVDFVTVNDAEVT